MGCGASKPPPPTNHFSYRVTVLGARNLFNNSFGCQLPGTHTQTFNFSGSSDPYVVLESEGTRHKTTTCLHTVDPVWNEEFIFAIGTRTPKLKLTVYDADALSKDDPIGIAELNLHGLLERGVEREMWIPLTGKNAKGEIGISVTETYRMRVEAIEGTEVEAKDALSGTSDCYMTMNVGQQERQKTTVQGWTRNPVWRQAFVFYVPFDQESLLELVLWDHDRIKNDESMGWHNIKITGKPKDKERRELELPLVHAKGTIKIAITDDLTVDAPAPAPVTEEMKAKFPPAKPQTATFTVRAIGAYNLAASDHNFLSDFTNSAVNTMYHEFKEYTGTSDPFARITCEGVTYDTKHINNTLAPHWNETFKFVAKNREESSIRIQVFDHDLVANDAIGGLDLPLNQMKPGENTEMWSFLDHGRGEIGVEARMNFNIKVRILDCENLEAADLNGLCDPYVKLTIAAADADEKKWYQTRIRKETRSPWFGEDFRFSMATLDHTALYLEVYDGDLLISKLKSATMSEHLGSYTHQLEGLAPGIPTEFTWNLQKDGKDTAGSKIRVELTNEIPVPPSVLNMLAKQGKEAYEAAVKKLAETKDFIKQLKPPNFDTKEEEVVEPCDPKIAKRPRFSKFEVKVLGIRGLKCIENGPVYVGVCIPTQGLRVKTDEKMDTVDPDFDHTTEFSVSSKYNTGIELSVFQSSKAPYTDPWSPNTSDKIFIPFKDLNKGNGPVRGSEANDEWFPLPTGGEIGIRVRERFRFMIRIESASGVDAKADPYVIMTVDNEKFTTHTVGKHPKGCPTWDEQFTMFVPRKEVDVTFMLKDEEIIQDGLLGEAKFNLASLRRGVPVTEELETKGGKIKVTFLEEEKMALLDQIIDAAANAAKLAKKGAEEAVNAVKDAASNVAGKIGGLFGK